MLILTFILGCRTQAAPSIPTPIETPPASSATTVSVNLPTRCTRYILDVTPDSIVAVCFDAGSSPFGRQDIKAPPPPFAISIVHTDDSPSPLASKP